MLTGKAPRKTLLAEAIVKINYDKLQGGKGSFLIHSKYGGLRFSHKKRGSVK